MKEISDSIDKVINGLQFLKTNIEEVSNLEERKSRLEADLSSLIGRHETLKAQLTKTEVELVNLQATAKKKLEAEIYQRQGDLRSLQDRIGIAEARLKEVAAESDAKASQLNGIKATMADLKGRLG